mgnify:CR=1 FL=1
MGYEKNDSILSSVEKYNRIIKEKAQKLAEIEALKIQITKLETECKDLDLRNKETEMEMQAEIYSRYSEKDLLKMIPTVEKLANKEVANDFRELVTKFTKHELQVNDISQLDTYCKIYGKYVREESSIIKGLFKALGGNLDG